LPPRHAPNPAYFFHPFLAQEVALFDKPQAPLGFIEHGSGFARLLGKLASTKRKVNGYFGTLPNIAIAKALDALECPTEIFPRAAPRKGFCQYALGNPPLDFALFKRTLGAL
jgi:hypothetical protein